MHDDTCQLDLFLMVILQYIYILNHYIVYLTLILCYMPITSQYQLINQRTNHTCSGVKEGFEGKRKMKVGGKVKKITKCPKDHFQTSG